MRLQSTEEIAARAAATTPAEHIDSALRSLRLAEASPDNKRYARLLLSSIDFNLRKAQEKLAAAAAIVNAVPEGGTPSLCNMDLPGPESPSPLRPASVAA